MKETDRQKRKKQERLTSFTPSETKKQNNGVRYCRLGTVCLKADGEEVMPLKPTPRIEPGTQQGEACALQTKLSGQPYT